MARTAQLRMYRIQEGRLEEFLRGWREGVVPLRRRFGFRVEGAWMMPEEGRFVWIISYDGPEGFEARDAEYYDSDERKGLDPDPAALVESSELYLMTSVPFGDG